LNHQLCKKPVQVMRCSLFNVRSVGEDAQNWNWEHLDVIHVEPVHREFRGTVISAGPPLQVEMHYSPFKLSSFDSDLVLKGLAEYANLDFV